MNLPRLVFIDEKCEDLKLFLDGGELTFNKKKKSDILPAYKYLLREKCYIRN